MSYVKNTNVCFSNTVRFKELPKKFLNFFVKNLQNFDFNCADVTSKILQDILHIYDAHFVIHGSLYKDCWRKPTNGILEKTFSWIVLFQNAFGKMWANSDHFMNIFIESIKCNSTHMYILFKIGKFHFGLMKPLVLLLGIMYLLQVLSS